MNRKTPSLTVVQPAADQAAIPTPPRQLGEAGAALWARVQAEYQVTDAGGIELLCLACQAIDRAEACKVAIDTDGEVVRTKAGPRPHPLLKEEIANRALVSRLIGRLGLDVEPVRSGPGRPPGFT